MVHGMDTSMEDQGGEAKRTAVCALFDQSKGQVKYKVPTDFSS